MIKVFATDCYSLLAKQKGLKGWNEIWKVKTEEEAIQIINSKGHHSYMYRLYNTTTGETKDKRHMEVRK